MKNRDNLGRFSRGHKGGPGRPKSVADYRLIARQQLSPTKFRKLVDQAIKEALNGSPSARQWLTSLVVDPVDSNVNLNVNDKEAELQRYYDHLYQNINKLTDDQKTFVFDLHARMEQEGVSKLKDLSSEELELLENTIRVLAVYNSVNDIAAALKN